MSGGGTKAQLRRFRERCAELGIQIDRERPGAHHKFYLRAKSGATMMYVIGTSQSDTNAVHAIESHLKRFAKS